MDTTDEEESSPRNQKKRTARDVACPGGGQVHPVLSGGMEGVSRVLPSGTLQTGPETWRVPFPC